jgi:hypothetical protein
MPSTILSLWATYGGKAAVRGPQKDIWGAAKPPPHPHRISPVNNIDTHITLAQHHAPAALKRA